MSNGQGREKEKTKNDEPNQRLENKNVSLHPVTLEIKYFEQKNNPWLVNKYSKKELTEVLRQTLFNQRYAGVRIRRNRRTIHDGAEEESKWLNTPYKLMVMEGDGRHRFKSTSICEWESLSNSNKLAEVRSIAAYKNSCGRTKARVKL